MTDASKMRNTSVQGVESTIMPGRAVEPENFPRPVEGNFPFFSDVLPLCKTNMVPITIQWRVFGTKSEGKTVHWKSVTLTGDQLQPLPCYKWGRELRVVMSLKHPRTALATISDLCFLISSTAAQIAENQTTSFIWEILALRAGRRKATYGYDLYFKQVTP